MTMFEPFFFYQKYYKQCDGVAMGSPLEPTLTNNFPCYFEKIFLENCPTQLKHVVYRRYMDDTFLMFRSTEHAEKLKKYLNKQNKNIVFISRIEQNCSLSFVDITTTELSHQFTESLHLVEFLPILKVLFPNLINIV